MKIRLIFLFCTALLITSCAVNVKPVLYDENSENFIITIKDITPKENSRCYYMITIDKNEVGRTEISPESSEKRFTRKISPGEYKIKIRKYMVDSRVGKYVPVNNLEQPKPASQVITIPPKKMVKLSIVHNSIQQRTSWNVSVY